MIKLSNTLYTVFSFLFLAISVICACNAKRTNDLLVDQKQDSIQLSKSIWVIYQDQNKKYWYGSNGDGLFSWDGKKLKQYTTKDGLCNDQIRGIHEDSKGKIYIDTREGISVFDGESFKTLIPVSGNKNHWQLKDQDLWFKGGSENNDIFRYDGDTLFKLKFSDIDQLSLTDKHCVYSIYKDKVGCIWFGTLTAGVCRFNGKRLEWIFEEELSTLSDGRVPAVRSIIEDKEGYFWLSNTLNKYQIEPSDKNNQAFKYKKLEGYNIPNNSIKPLLPYYTSAVVDKRDQSIWMSSYNDGIWHFNGKFFDINKLKNGDENVLIVSIYQDLDGELWLGTDNFGLYRYTGKTFEPFHP